MLTKHSYSFCGTNERSKKAFYFDQICSEISTGNDDLNQFLFVFFETIKCSYRKVIDIITLYMMDTSVFKTIYLLLAQGKIGLFHQNIHVLSSQSYPTLCDPTDCSLPDSSVLGILQARILEWVVMPSSRGSSQPRNRTQVSYIS